MIWLQKPPWIRWTLALLIAGASIWVEFGSDRSTQHPFAIADISPGDAITDHNVELRPIPTGILDPVTDFGVATRQYAAGDPITSTGISDEVAIAPTGWWALELSIPPGATVGDEVQLVLIDTGVVVPGRVQALNDVDPLSDGKGSVAIPPEHAAAAAAAVASARVVVLVAAG